MAKKVHGTIGCYQRGCRQPGCKAVWAAYMLAYRHRLGLTKPRDAARYYVGDAERIGVKLTELAQARLAQTVERTGRLKDDVIEQLVREHVDAVCFDAEC